MLQVTIRVRIRVKMGLGSSMKKTPSLGFEKVVLLGNWV